MEFQYKNRGFGLKKNFEIKPSLGMGITNALRELSKSIDGASRLQFRELKRVAKYVLDTKNLGLRIVPGMKNGIRRLEALSDSDFANDKDTRISIYGYIVFFCEVPIACNSKSMRSVVLSTTEAEYVAVSEVVKEIKFLYQVLSSMEIKVPLPTKIKKDNVGAIWLGNNSGNSERTKHVDIRAHFVRSYVIDEVVTIDFVKSAENRSDIMTKNQQGVYFKSAQPIYCESDRKCREESSVKINEHERC